MAKNQGSSNREAKIAKAGKRSGGYQDPPAPKSDNQVGRDNGMQQFHAKRQLTAEKEISVIVYDKALKGFVNRTKKITVPVDHHFDENRRHLVFSPTFKEKRDK